MKRVGEMSLTELGALICSHLLGRNIHVTLSGGSCVMIYSDGPYVSFDLDLINQYNESRRKIKAAMEEIGFKEERKYFTHPETDYFVEFPPGPLGVGDEPVKRIDEIPTETGVLRIISPTDCVKDRLAAWYHWDDRQSLDQAVWVAQKHKVDLGELARWSEAEGMVEKFKAFTQKQQA